MTLTRIIIGMIFGALLAQGCYVLAGAVLLAWVVWRWSVYKPVREWEGADDECPVHSLPLDDTDRCPKCLLLPEEAKKELRR